MKKILATLLAFISVLSFTAFTACDNANNGNGEESQSDVVTEEEWVAAFQMENFINVTVEGTILVTYAEEWTYNEEGEAIVDESQSEQIKVALTDNETYAEGNTYMRYETSKDGSAVIEMYEVLAENQYSYVSKMSSIDSTDSWYGILSSQGITANESLVFGGSADIVYADMYNNFEYIDGAYVFVNESDLAISQSTYMSSGTYTIKFKDGHFTSVVCVGDNYSMSMFYTNYGTTTIEVPEEFTYDYYLANHTV